MSNFDPIASGNIARDLYREMWGVEYTDRLSAIRVLTLITAGDHDECDPSLSRAMHEKIGGSKLVVFPQSGHMTFVNQPTLFVRTIEEFLAGNP